MINIRFIHIILFYLISTYVYYILSYLTPKEKIKNLLKKY